MACGEYPTGATTTTKKQVKEGDMDKAFKALGFPDWPLQVAKKEGKKVNPLYMGGTENTGEYLVLAVTPKGKIGVRHLGNQVRVRVEPAKGADLKSSFPDKYNWKQPGEDDQPRFSKVLTMGAELKKVLLRAVKTLGIKAGEKGVVVNDAAPGWFHEAAGYTPPPKPEPAAETAPTADEGKAKKAKAKKAATA